MDLINGMLRLIQSGREAVEAGAQAAQKAIDLAARALEDPELIVRMIPRHQRGFAADTVLSVPGFGFACHLSAYLLLPEEARSRARRVSREQAQEGQRPGRVARIP